MLVSNLQNGTQGGRGRVKTRMTKVVCNRSENFCQHKDGVGG